MFDIESVIEHVRFTPAERAVLVEQAETLKVQTDKFRTDVQNSQHADIVRGYLDMARTMKNIDDLCSLTVRRAVHNAEAQR